MIANIKKYQNLLLLFLGLFLAYYVWKRISSPYGNQKVDFKSSKSVKYTLGDFSYSVYGETKDPQNIIYYFHGRNLDDEIWNDDTYFTSMIQSQWQKSSSSPPTIVAVSYGPIWLLAPKNSSKKSGLLEDIIKKIESIEAKLGVPQQRILLGESMGGLNVLVLGLSYPDKFTKIAALCPGVYLDSPFDKFDKLKKTLIRTGADPKIALGLFTLIKDYCKTEKEWNQISPISLMANADDNFPELYLSCGLYDAYGNYEGTQKLAELAQKKGLRTHWHPLYGGHCAIDISSLSNFLISK